MNIAINKPLERGVVSNSTVKRHDPMVTVMTWGGGGIPCDPLDLRKKGVWNLEVYPALYLETVCVTHSGEVLS